MHQLAVPISESDCTGTVSLMYSGDDLTCCDFVHLGGDGVISVTANVAPALMKE